VTSFKGQGDMSLADRPMIVNPPNQSIEHYSNRWKLEGKVSNETSYIEWGNIQDLENTSWTHQKGNTRASMNLHAYI